MTLDSHIILNQHFFVLTEQKQHKLEQDANVPVYGIYEVYCSKSGISSVLYFNPTGKYTM